MTRIGSRLVARFTPAEEEHARTAGCRTGLARARRDRRRGRARGSRRAVSIRVGRWTWSPAAASHGSRSSPSRSERPSPRHGRGGRARSGLPPRSDCTRPWSSCLGGPSSAPALLVLEDLHWADEASFALLEALAEAAASKPWLADRAPASRRPADSAGSGATRIDLPALEPEAVVQARPRGRPERPPCPTLISPVITERAAGNPLFARELATAAAEQGGMENLPDRLETLLASRIDRLGGKGRALLRRAAVLGRTVDLELLGEVIEDDEGCPRPGRLGRARRLRRPGRLEPGSIPPRPCPGGRL